MPFDDGVQMSPDSSRGDDAAREVHSNGGNAGAGSARSNVHSIRPVGSLIGDRFVVKAHLGRGRSGERYEAVDRSLSDPDMANERCVVLHFLNGRVAQQTRVLQKLETSYHQPHSWAHRNIFSVLAFGSDRGEYFFVTEELEGGTLRAILDDVAPEVPSEEETFSVLSGIGDALKYAHAKGVVHGDIRPENIFVTTDLVVKVLDLLPATLLRAVPLFPEDKSSEGPSVPDPRDDVYGLACVAYELFAGRHPFNSNTALEALAAGLKPPPIPRLDARSWDALVRGLALRREQRTSNVATFLADLGVTGRERLRRDGEDDRADSTNDVPIIYESPVPRAAPAARAAEPARDSDAGARVANWRMVDDDSRYELFKIRRDEPARRSTSWLALAAVLIAGIGAAVYWDLASVRERGPELVAMGRSLIDRVAQTKVATPPDRPSEPAAAPSPSPEVADAGSAPASGRAAPPAASPAPTTARPSPDAASGPAAAPAPKEAGPPKQSSPQPSAIPPPAGTADASPLRATQAPPTTDVVAPAPPASETFEFEKPVVVVSEAAPSAAITVRRTGALDASTTFVWWTSDGTAVADEDYVNFGARIEKLAVGEQTRTIHVPIVHNPKRRGRDNFYVNVRPGQSKREDPAQRVEVVISR